MSGSGLERLLSEDLQANACAFSTAPALRLFFGQRPEVREVQEGLQRGTITESAVREFVATLVKGVRPGTLFANDLTLSALAIAFSDLQAPFADAFLRELAELKVAEMPLGPRIAREVLAQRTSLDGHSAPNKGVTGAVETSLPSEPAHPPS
jgi:hypothetical protein